jgi:hypothetical protein
MGFFIDEISKIDTLIQQRVSGSPGDKNVVKNHKTDTAFNDMLNANIEKNKGNKGGLAASNSLSREKLKLLAEIIQE